MARSQYETATQISVRPFVAASSKSNCFANILSTFSHGFGVPCDPMRRIPQNARKCNRAHNCQKSTRIGDLQATSRCNPQGAGHRLRAENYELQAASCRPQAAGHKRQATSYRMQTNRLQAISRKQQTASYRPQVLCLRNSPHDH